MPEDAVQLPGGSAPPFPVCPLFDENQAVTDNKKNLPLWACGAAGSALPWHGRGRRFDPDQVHHHNQQFRREERSRWDVCVMGCHGVCHDPRFQRSCRVAEVVLLEHGSEHCSDGRPAAWPLTVLLLLQSEVFSWRCGNNRWRYGPAAKSIAKNRATRLGPRES
jgi:hypothetical protein